MMGRTHSATGMVLWAGVGPLVTHDVGVLVVGLVLGAVLPYGADLDHPQSTSSRALWGPLHRSVGSRIGSLLGGHRAGAHSLWACLLAALCGAVLGTYWKGETALLPMALASGLGWFGGVLGDMLTERRVRFLWPASSVRVGVAVMKTGGVGEALFNLLQVCLGLWFVYLHVGGI